MTSAFDVLTVTQHQTFMSGICKLKGEFMDTLLLSRIQFGANISFHILFPTITIALGWALLFFKLRFNRTGDRKWMDAIRSG